MDFTQGWSNIGTVAALVLSSGLVGGLAGSAMTSWLTTKRDRVGDQRRLRDLKAARLRTAFAPMLRVAMTRQDVAAKQTGPRECETAEDRDARLSVALREAGQGLPDAIVALQLEPGMEAITAAFQETWSTYTNYQTTKGMGIQLAADGQPQDLGILKKREALDASIQGLQKQMLDVLLELENPL